MMCDNLIRKRQEIAVPQWVMERTLLLSHFPPSAIPSSKGCVKSHSECCCLLVYLFSLLSLCLKMNLIDGNANQPGLIAPGDSIWLFFLYFPFLLFLSNFATFLGWSEFCDDDLYREPTSFGIGTTVVPISANSISKELDCGYTWWDKRQNIHIYKKKWQPEILSCRLRSQAEQITLKVGSKRLLAQPK